MFYLTMHSAYLFLRLYVAGHIVKDHSKSRKELFYLTHSLNTFYLRLYGRKEMFYLTTHRHILFTVIWCWTHGKGPFKDQEGRKCFIQLYGIRHMVKDHSDSERENPLPPQGYSFQLAARVLLYAPSHRQDSTYHSLCYTSRGALAGLLTVRHTSV